MNYDRKNVSYLQARDPSILTWNFSAAAKVVKKNLEDIFENTEFATEEDNNLNVFLRIKGGVPCDKKLYEVDGNVLICHIPDGVHSSRNIKEGDKVKRKFTFSKIFNSVATQTEIFASIVKPKALSFINGRNSTLFTYGASGSGKTFTIVGTPEEPGIVPRALEYIFRTIPGLNQRPLFKPLPNGDIEELNSHIWSLEEKNKLGILNSKILDRHVHVKNYREMQERLSSEAVAMVESHPSVMVSIWVSFAEIYNENVYDLLTAIPKGTLRQKLRLGNNRGESYIKDLTMVHVSNGMEAYQILQYGIQNLNYAATALNSHSSRSHSIFSMKLLQTSSVDDKVYITNFNFCDLAGAERLKKTGNMGDRLKESNNINTSLMILGRCIENIRSNQKVKEAKPIPFRESKLTQLFQKALLGQENISMIVNISSMRNMFDETQHVLNFSAVAKDIVIEEQPKRTITRPNRFSVMMENKKAVDKIKPTIPVINHGEKDRQIEELQDTIYDLHLKIDELRAEHDKQLLKELERAVDEYSEYHEKMEKEWEAQKNKQLAAQKQYYEEQIENLRDFYENKNDVINISSSSCESSFVVNDHETENNKLRADLERLRDENTKLQKDVKQLILDNRNLQLELKNKNELLQDAEDAYNDLKCDNDKIYNENRKLKEEIFLLQEKVDNLEEMELLKITHFKEDPYPSILTKEENIEDVEIEQEKISEL